MVMVCCNCTRLEGSFLSSKESSRNTEAATVSAVPYHTIYKYIVWCMDIYIYNYICLTYIYLINRIYKLPLPHLQRLLSIHFFFRVPGPEWFRTDVWCGKCVTLIGKWAVGKTPKGWWFLVKGIYPPKCPKHSGWQNGCFGVLYKGDFFVDGGGFGWGWVFFKIYLGDLNT